MVTDIRRFDREAAVALRNALAGATRTREAAHRAVVAGLRDSPEPELMAALNDALAVAEKSESSAMLEYRTYLSSASDRAKLNKKGR